MFASGFQDPHFYNGTYTMGEMTDHYKVDNYLAANPNLLPLDVPATRGSSDPANYDLIERVSAGYIMNTINLDRLRLQTGLRLEATHEYGMGYLVNPTAGPNGDGMDNNGNWIGTTAGYDIPRTTSILCPAFKPVGNLRPRLRSARSTRAASPGPTSTTWCRTLPPPAVQVTSWPLSATPTSCPPTPTTTICCWSSS